MLFEIIRSEGLSHNSYLIGSQGKAAVIDPRRDCEIYTEIAYRADMAITHIFETHRNEDYCIGSLELAAQSGAEIYHGSQLPFVYGRPLHDGDCFKLGNLELTILETPGHTEESVSILLTDHEVSPEPYMIFCGDTLFAGDIARTDFFGRERYAEMAGKIYDSISRKIIPLGDGVIVCPAHGAGSVCGGNIADHSLTTIGYERKTNHNLTIGREEFIKKRSGESPYTPPYFRRMEMCNLNGPAILSQIPRPPHLSIGQINEFIYQGAQLLDIRSPISFASGHIPDSLSIWRDGVPAFAGWYLGYDSPIVIIDDFNLDPEDIVRWLIRLGYDNIAGFLAGGFAAWFKGAQKTVSFGTCTVQQLYERLQTESLFILDVRDIKNFSSVGHINGAHQIYVGELPQHIHNLPKNRWIVVICDTGFKGSLAASFLQKNGFSRITNILGGMTAWINAGFPVEKLP
ncbi:MAG: thiosulfate sulfurtransferase [Methanoregula sp. PtaU1.Bin051]|nr:MAG: thiosulfate sulfurtransferase [Methanoregula sp. PtaU1.Bin051]